MMQTINMLLLELQSMGEDLTDTFCLQMDNCWRENKNQFVLNFLALLAKLDILLRYVVLLIRKWNFKSGTFEWTVSLLICNILLYFELGIALIMYGQWNSFKFNFHLCRWNWISQWLDTLMKLLTRCLTSKNQSFIFIISSWEENPH